MVTVASDSEDVEPLRDESRSCDSDSEAKMKTTKQKKRKTVTLKSSKGETRAPVVDTDLERDQKKGYFV